MVHCYHTKLCALPLQESKIWSVEAILVPQFCRHRRAPVRKNSGGETGKMKERPIGCGIGASCNLTGQGSLNKPTWLGQLNTTPYLFGASKLTPTGICSQMTPSWLAEKVCCISLGLIEMQLVHLHHMHIHLTRYQPPCPLDSTINRSTLFVANPNWFQKWTYLMWWAMCQ